MVLVACGDDASPAADKATTTTKAAPVIDPGDGGDYRPDIDPARFVDRIDNPYLPLLPGARWVYEDATSGEHTEVAVTADRKQILGISAVVVRDTVTVDGEVQEDTYDWFAQDVEGNVWYLGEHSEEHEDGKISTAGSWEAGVDGALPGIVMPAHPEAGQAYRQEFYPGEAEDLAEVVRLGAADDVPTGSYHDVVVIEEWNPLEPDVVEQKHYAPGVGQILEETTVGGDGRAELVAFTPGA
jgi:hypothetical protein